MNIYSSKQFYEADKVTTEKQNISSTDLMERAATQIFNWLDQRMQGAQVPMHIFCGIGNNGGDGLALGRLLIEKGYNVHMYIANFTDKRSKCFLINYGRVKDVTTKWPVLMSGEADFPVMQPEDIIVDALFGIGLNRAPEGWVKKLIQHINAQRSFKLAVDIPSGLSSESPLLDEEAVVKANHTLTFQAPKLSFFLPATGKFVPYFEVLDIGLDPEFLMTTQPLARTVMKPQAQTFYKQREKYAHKGTFGHALVVGGSKGKMGAVVLATKGALLSGSGLATALVPENGLNILQTAIPEAMVVTSSSADHISETKLEFDPTVIAVGPGMGQSDDAFKALKQLIVTSKNPMVIDADAINLLAKNKTALKKVPKQSIFTPHHGELERLIGGWKDDFDKLAKTKAFAKEYEVIVVVKGANSIVVFGDEMFINTTGNPGMATAGSGDVLTGVITGLLAQGYDAPVASMFGTYLHGSAGNLASQETGFEALLAGDVAAYIGRAFIELFQQDAPPPKQEKQ